MNAIASKLEDHADLNPFGPALSIQRSLKGPMFNLRSGSISLIAGSRMLNGNDLNTPVNGVVIVDISTFTIVGNTLKIERHERIHTIRPLSVRGPLTRIALSRLGIIVGKPLWSRLTKGKLALTALGSPRPLK